MRVLWEGDFVKFRHLELRPAQRVFVYGGLWTDMNLPRLSVCVDGDHVSVGASYGNPGSDPVIGIDVYLSGTRAGRLLAEAYWWLDDRRRR